MRAIARDALPNRIVMLTAAGPAALVYDMMSLGCAAFLTKTATLADICDAVAAVARGDTVIAAELAHVRRCARSSAPRPRIRRRRVDAARAHRLSRAQRIRTHATGVTRRSRIACQRGPFALP
jgi:two-component system nitrate/nitrite response regulator NarL